MKKIIGIVFAMILSISILTACAGDENKQTIETTVLANHIETTRIPKKKKQI